MIKFENPVTPSPEQWEAIIRGMRNPKNSWDRMDSVCMQCQSGMCDICIDYDECPFSHNPDMKFFTMGEKDHDLMMRLANGGPVHAKYRRMITVYVDITAPLYWWKEFDTYKIGTVANSCSTMHKIHENEFVPTDFSCERLGEHSWPVFKATIDELNYNREKFIETKEKQYWEQMIQLLPSSYNQRRTIMLNFEVLTNIYHSRKNHKLQEWHDMCDWIENELPYSEIIMGGKECKEII